MKNIKIPFIYDPDKKSGSITLTNFVLSIIFLIVVMSLHVSGKVDHISSALEYLGISAALYLGRRVSIKDKKISLSKEKSLTKK